MEQFSGFVVAAQYGGSMNEMDDHVWSLKRIVEARMRSTRARGVDSVHLVFRVDGMFSTYECSKAERLEISKRYRAAGVDLGVPLSAWVDRPSDEIRFHLCECVDAALDLLVARFKKDRICEGCESLYDDWKPARAEYLATP